MDRISLDLLSAHRALWLALIPAAVALAVWVYFRTIAPLTRPARNVLRALRALAFLCVLFALAEPVLTLVLPEPGKPGLAVLVDGSASMAFPSGDPSYATRAGEENALERKIEDQLQGHFRLDRFRFGADLKPLGDDPNAPPSGNTAIGGALDAIAARQGSRPVGGVLLLSDGANTVGSDPVGAARNAGIPIFPVRVGAPAPPPDARVLQVRANPVAFAGEPASIEVEVASSGMKGKSIELRVEDQGKVLASQPITFASGEENEQAVRLDVRPGGVGLRRWEVRLAGANDAVPENDVRSIGVRVLERKTRVLFVEGRIDWDFTFLRRTFGGDSTFSYRFLLADHDGRWMPDRAGGAPPAGPGDLRDYAAVILGELPPGAGGADLYRELAGYVDQGGGLLILGGRGGVSRFRGTPLEPLLPAAALPGPRFDVPVGVRLNAAGITHPLTAIEDTPARTEADWASLPPIWTSPDRLRVKPGASTLLDFTVPGGTAPALVTGFAGEGKIALLDGHDFWRWGFLPRGASAQPGPEVFPEFALRMVRWLAEPTIRDRFVAEPARGVFENGEPPEFTARVWDEKYAPVTDARVHVRVTPADSAARAVAKEFDLRPRGEEGTYGGQTEPLAPGAYRFVAEARSADGATLLGRAESSFWVDRNGPEYVRLRPDPGTLDQIAKESGGESVDGAGLASLLSRLPSVVRHVGRVREIELWNNLALFLSFVALLSVEWWLRRRRGLA